MTGESDRLLATVRRLAVAEAGPLAVAVRELDQCLALGGELPSEWSPVARDVPFAVPLDADMGDGEAVSG